MTKWSFCQAHSKLACYYCSCTECAAGQSAKGLRKVEYISEGVSNKYTLSQTHGCETAEPITGKHDNNSSRNGKTLLQEILRLFYTCAARGRWCGFYISHVQWWEKYIIKHVDEAFMWSQQRSTGLMSSVNLMSLAWTAEYWVIVDQYDVCRGQCCYSVAAWFHVYTT